MTGRPATDQQVTTNAAPAANDDLATAEFSELSALNPEQMYQRAHDGTVSKPIVYSIVGLAHGESPAVLKGEGTSSRATKGTPSKFMRESAGMVTRLSFPRDSFLKFIEMTNKHIVSLDSWAWTNNNFDMFLLLCFVYFLHVFLCFLIFSNLLPIHHLGTWGNCCFFFTCKIITRPSKPIRRSPFQAGQPRTTATVIPKNPDPSGKFIGLMGVSTSQF